MQKAKSVSDEHLIRREIYNPNKFPLIFELMVERVDYLIISGITPGPHAVPCKPDDFCLLNHAYYRVKTPDDRFATFIQHFGDAIGRGLKKASNPYGEGH